jgi:predicted DsbA family dithiol-disulfide isomerase
MSAPVQIDVISDVICPWCFLGKRRLDKALEMVPDLKTEVVFRPFYLDPTIPGEGVDRAQYMEAKFGKERLKTIHDPLIAGGKADGVPYDFDKITRTPNTLSAHRVLRWALPGGEQLAVAEALFMAYWNQGRDVGDHAVLAEIAASCGMDGLKVQADLATDKDREAVLQEMSMAQRMGVTGVPTFIINRKYGVVGAQSPEVIVQALQKAAAEA